MRIQVAAPLAALAVCARLAGQDEPGPVTRTETRTESLAYGSKLRVRNRNGAILVTGWDREELQLTAEIRDSDQRRIELLVQRQGPDLAIDAQSQQSMLPLPSAVAASPRCRMTLNVPRHLLAQFRTTNGQGYVRCETTNGDISLAGIAGEVRAETTNGNLTASHLHARIQGGTANGEITLEDVDGRVQVETTNGQITARNLDGWGEGIRLACANGPIDLELGRATGEIEAANESGSIRIRVASGLVLEQNRHRVHVKVPGSSQMIVLETVNGSIHVH